MTKPRTLVLLLAILFFASVGVAWWWRSGSVAPGSALLGQGTPAEIMAEVRARDHGLTVVNFWASWCEPCKREFPFFLRLRRELSAAGVGVLFVSVDDGADFAEAAQFLSANGVDFPSFYKGKQSLNFVAEIFPNWSGAVPATVIFGPHGEVLESWEGDTTWDTLERLVRRHLRDAS